jgi:hypothetical protein
MKRLFYCCIVSLIVFEILNVFFIMPLPGSQKMDSLDFAYFIYQWRWFFRFIIGVGIIISVSKAFAVKRKWVPIVVMIIAGIIVYMANFEMRADKMFLQPKQLIFTSERDNNVPLDRLIIGIKHNGETKAYPISFLVYHHQVFDEIGGVPVIVTYCNVCRSGRVFEPKVKGKLEKFRLVGMDHFNAMFEDETTGSWWRQENGKAVTGKLKGEQLPEMISQQMSLSKWLELYPDSKIMQADPNFRDEYDYFGKFEKGTSKSSLTGTSEVEWGDKSWVVGVEINGVSKAYSWNDLKDQLVINDKVGGKSIIVALSKDNNSFVVLENPTGQKANLLKDEIVIGEEHFNFSGEGTNTKSKLTSVQAYQEFWHSWLTFHPRTLKYE